VIAVFGAQALRVRILSFQLPEQVLHVLGLAFMAAAVILLLNLLLGADFPGFLYVLSPAVTGLLWAPVSWILHSPLVRLGRRDMSP
jgi:rod shape-determining protein MreD